MKFKSSKNGKLLAVRFYKSSKESGTHVGHIWSSSGALLATVTFSGETISGWQMARLSTPLKIRANRTYIVSVNTAKTYYVDTIYGLKSSIVNGPLSTIAGSNGVFGRTGKFPTQTWNSSNYFRDVVFQPN
jgi:hypothetical protein